MGSEETRVGGSGELGSFTKNFNLTTKVKTTLGIIPAEREMLCKIS